MKLYTEMNEIRRKCSCESTFFELLNYSAHRIRNKELDNFSHSFVREVEMNSDFGKTELLSVKISSLPYVSLAKVYADRLKLAFLSVPESLVSKLFCTLFSFLSLFSFANQLFRFQPNDSSSIEFSFSIWTFNNLDIWI